MLYHKVTSDSDDYIWNLILQHQCEIFHTSTGLPFTYAQKLGQTGKPIGELVISRKKKTITRNTVLLAYENATALMESEGCVSGPKKLGVHGASYLYPVFLKLGICTKQTDNIPEIKES